jgi:Protein of unknown function (DUF1629)
MARAKPREEGRAVSSADRPSGHAVVSKAARAPKKSKPRRLYLIESAWAGDFPYRMLNNKAFVGDDDIFSRPTRGYGFPRVAEPPVFLFIGRAERDFWEFCTYWFVSDRMKAFLEQFDPEAFDFLKCEIKLPNGASSPVRWLCDVVRVIDAVDEEKSSRIIIGRNTMGEKYLLQGQGSYVFKEDAVGPHHVFHIMHSPHEVVGDEEFKRACKAAGLKGISFYRGAETLR